VERDAAAAVDAVELGASSSMDVAMEQGLQAKQLPWRVGGEVRLLGGLVVDGSTGKMSQQSLSLRMLLDGSLLEVFTDGGEALATRVYRTSSTAASVPSSSSKLQVAAFGGAAQLCSCRVWEMESCWAEDGESEEPVALPIQQLNLVDLPATASAAAVACEAAVAAAAAATTNAAATAAAAAAATAATAWQVQPLVLEGLLEGVMQSAAGLASPLSPAAEMPSG
jgi:hypothetical protein